MTPAARPPDYMTRRSGTSAPPKVLHAGVFDDEMKYRALWKRFYNTIAIKERINPNLRRQHMPKKFEKYYQMSMVDGAKPTALPSDISRSKDAERF